jgi:hypothetical protein
MITFQSETFTLTVMDSFYSDGTRSSSQTFAERIRYGNKQEMSLKHLTDLFNRRYLYWQIRKKQPDFTEDQISIVWPMCSLPQQGNGRDCGVYSLLFGLYAVLAIPIDFTDRHMEYFRRKIAWDLLSGRIHLALADQHADRKCFRSVCLQIKTVGYTFRWLCSRGVTSRRAPRHGDLVGASECTGLLAPR